MRQLFFGIPQSVSGKPATVRRLLLVLFCLAVVLGANAHAKGVVWRDITLDKALEEAAKHNTMVMIDVYADHCMQCKVMDNELWDTPTGGELADGLIPLRIPSDKPEGRLLQRRYPVLGLPLTLFLLPDGTELDRIVGYQAVEPFLSEAEMLKAGSDPLPHMEERLAKNPNSLSLSLEVLQKLLYRKRIAEAEALLSKMVKLDPERKAKEPAQAMIYVAKYHSYFRLDEDKAQQHWRTIVEQYPHSGSTTSGVKGTYEFARSQGQLNEWIAWICPIIEKNPDAGRLNYNVATFANRGRLRHPCLGQAAKNASAQGVGKAAFMDSIAVVLAGQ
ncbi:thioredoxin family protein [Candidatus Eisenbacteria bacterium]|uniref:Thioredoxin family protein n=1 Tax=Eiseniibacteriota bacterium TaxID=2212470 RepID=A0ABV6YJ67_UNCEI